MYNNLTQCTFGCFCVENQQHIFEECMPLKRNLQLKGGVKIADVYGDLKTQKAAISDFIQIEANRLELKKNMEEKTCKYVHIA